MFVEVKLATDVEGNVFTKKEENVDVFVRVRREEVLVIFAS